MNKREIVELIQMSDDAATSVEEPLLTIDQVAVRLGVSSQTIRNWEKQGKLVPNSRTEGGHRRYSQRQVVDFKKEHKDFEILLKISPIKLMLGLEHALANFRSDDKVYVSIQHDDIRRRVHFVIDSEDGLQSYTKTLILGDDSE